MNADYLHELDDAEYQKERRNKVTYQRIGSTKNIDEKESIKLGDQNSIAFRKDALKALN